MNRIPDDLIRGLGLSTGRETGTLDEDAVTGRTEESTGTALADWDATVFPLPGIRNCWPRLILWFFMPLAARIASCVTPYRFAMEYMVSPRFTSCDATEAADTAFSRTGAEAETVREGGA